MCGDGIRDALPIASWRDGMVNSSGLRDPEKKCAEFKFSPFVKIINDVSVTPSTTSELNDNLHRASKVKGVGH